MPLRQIARTPKRPLPPRDGYGVPYAFAIEIRQLAPILTPDDWDIVIVRCPWCGDEEMIEPVGPPMCTRADLRYVVAIPAGTPVLV